MAVRFETASPSDIDDIVPRLREADKREIEALHGRLTAHLIKANLPYGDHFVGFWKEEPACIFGVQRVSFLPDVGSPWLLTTELVAQNPRPFMEWSRVFVNGWSAQFDVLVNYVDARYAAAIRWLRWLEFTIEPPEPYGVQGLPFHRAVRGE